MRLLALAGVMLAAPLVLVAGAVGVVLMAMGQSSAGAVNSHAPASAHAQSDIPERLLGVYQDATAQRCPGLAWTLLAAVGKVESDHARTGGADLQPGGEAVPWIIGPPLDGRAGVRTIADTDDGRWDRDPIWDRAAGPMQFLPATWRTHGTDASGSGEANPHNALDAIHTAAAYLCTHGADTPEGARQALYAYNNSDSYVDEVLTIANSYADQPQLVSAAAAGAYALPVERRHLSPAALQASHHDYPAWDLPLPPGTPVAAVHGGQVVSISERGTSCGRGVTIAGRDGARYSYCHARTVHVRVSDTVTVGQHVLDSGNSGRSTGPHLHLDITWHGQLVCPQPLLQAWYEQEPATPAEAPASGCNY